MFSIYVPGRRGEATQLLKSVGAEWALDPSVTAMATDIFSDGPDDGGGTLVHFDKPLTDPRQAITRVDRTTQIWEPAAPSGELPAGRFWLGLWKERRPGPEDLKRASMSDGMPLELGDGNHWVVPIADYLPGGFEVGPNSEFTQQRGCVVDRLVNFVAGG